MKRGCKKTPLFSLVMRGELKMQELYHHGIIGQKWGVRRFQNKDGTLTTAGKQRYKKSDGTFTREGKKAVKTFEKNYKKTGQKPTTRLPMK